MLLDPTNLTISGILLVAVFALWNKQAQNEKKYLELLERYHSALTEDIKVLALIKEKLNGKREGSV